MLVLKKAQAEQELAEQTAQLRSIEGRIREIDGEGRVPELDVVIKSIPDQHFLSVRTVVPNVPGLLMLIGDGRKAAQEHSAELAAATLATVLHSESFEVDDIDVEVGFLLTRAAPQAVTLPSGDRLTLGRLAGHATAATAIAVGGPEGCLRSYCAIGTWVENHAFRLAGAGREVFIVPPNGQQVADMVLEIQFPIER